MRHVSSISLKSESNTNTTGIWDGLLSVFKTNPVVAEGTTRPKNQSRFKNDVIEGAISKNDQISREREGQRGKGKEKKKKICGRAQTILHASLLPFLAAARALSRSLASCFHPAKEAPEPSRFDPLSTSRRFRLSISPVIPVPRPRPPPADSAAIFF